MSRSKIIALILVTLAIGIAAGFWISRHGMTKSPMANAAPAAQDRKALYSYDPMVPKQRFD